ncbi:MAG: GAF domain-containing hybrid sensor histidine kinase/response regulator [Desulfobacteria bacterium]
MQKRSIFLKILAIVTTVEFFVMVLLKFVHVPHGIVENVIDAILLSLFSAPFLYFFVILPVARGLAGKADLVRKTGEQAKALNGFAARLKDSETEEEKARILAERAQFLNRINTLALEESDIDSMLSGIAGEVCDFLGLQRCILRIYSDPEKMIEHHAPGLPEAASSSVFSRDSSVFRPVFETGRNVVLNDTRGISQSAGWKEDMDRILPGSCIGVLLRVQEDLDGILVFGREEPHVWTPEEVATAEAIARQTTVAFRHYQVFRRYAMAVEQSTDMIIITDREGTIQYVNPAFERITGYTREEAVGKNPRILHSGKHDEAFYRRLWDTLVRGDVWNGHFINRRKDGSLYEEDATISPLRDSSGKIVNYVAAKRDVTNVVSLERQVRMAQKMESVGTLAGGIAHDFNNALTGIIGFGEMLKLRIANDPKALSDVDEVLRSAERASVLTRQLLTFARRQVFDLANLDMNEVVTGLVKLLRKVTREDIEIKTFLAEGLPTIRADQGQVEQVLVNLSLNARDAMPGGGQLVVETQEARLDEEYVKRYPYMKAGRYAVLAVSDTGVGMDEATRERIFDPFFTTKGPDKGTGLGLAVVYGIVKQHNGFVHVYSEPGKGTTFRIYFPAVDVPADSKVSVVQGIIRGGSETILLAEDDESVRHLTEKILRSCGYTVLSARDGKEAVDIFRRHEKEIAMAVLDVVMPKMGGKQAYDEMIMTASGLKVLFLSGYSANAIHDSFVLHPEVPFIQKPFGPGALARKVREVLDRK